MRLTPPRRTGRARLGLTAALALSALTLAACGSSGGGSSSPAADPSTSESSTSSDAPSTPAASDIKVGLAYDVGGRGDRSFNDAAAAGLDKAEKELGVTAQELSPNASGSDRGDNLRSLAEDDYNPIIAVGFAYADSLKDIATDFPDTTFFIVDDSSIELPNVKSLVFAEEEGSFLVGAAAAMKSTTDNVGFIGGVQTPLIEKFEAGFVAGAKQVKPDIKVETAYLSQVPDFSGFGDPAKGKETANGMYDGGADIIFAAAGGSGTGVFQAAKAKDALAIGVDSDQYESIGDPELQPVILTSMLKRVDVAVFDALQKFSKDEEIPAVTTYDLSNDGVTYATSGGFVDDISDQLDELKQMIIDGKITVPTTP